MSLCNGIKKVKKMYFSKFSCASLLPQSKKKCLAFGGKSTYDIFWRG